MWWGRKSQSSGARPPGAFSPGTTISSYLGCTSLICEMRIRIIVEKILCKCPILDSNYYQHMCIVQRKKGSGPAPGNMFETRGQRGSPEEASRAVRV